MSSVDSYYRITKQCDVILRPNISTSLCTLTTLTSQRTSFRRTSLIMYFPDIMYFPSTALPLLRTSQYALEPILPSRLHNSQHAHLTLSSRTLSCRHAHSTSVTHTSIPTRTLLSTYPEISSHVVCKGKL